MSLALHKIQKVADKSAVLQGYFKKLKTMKKKFFVLYSDSVEKSARLEYYDSEKKFKSRFGQPKRSIVLKSCFHISRRVDTKHKYVVSLYTKDDCFCIVFETEMEMNRWLKELLALHRVEECEGEKPRASFGEYSFKKNIQNSFIFYYKDIKIKIKKKQCNSCIDRFFEEGFSDVGRFCPFM